MIESVYLEYRVDHLTFFFLKVNYYRCLGISPTSGAVIHPVQLAHYPAPGVQRPGVKSLGVWFVSAIVSEHLVMGVEVEARMFRLERGTAGTSD